MVPTATVTITNDATGLSATAHTDDHGLYILTGPRSVCTIPVDSAGFRKAEEKEECLAAG